MTTTTTTTTTTRQKSRSRRKQKVTKLITSKYFPRPSDSTTNKNNRRIHISQTTSAKAIEIGITSCSSSNYFLRSPSSAYGSVLSLGPLVYTWIGGGRRGSNKWISICNSREEVRLNCLRQRRRNSSPSSSRINDKERRKVCIYCAPILSEDAFRHFKDCLIFQNEQYKYYIIHDDDDDDDDDDDYSSTPTYTQIAGNDDCNNDHDQYKMTDVNIMFDTESSSSSSSSPSSLSSLTCVELVGRWAEQHSVRHLCPNQCFLRAFAPIREWMVLRKKLEKYTPIGEILNDWTCRLVFDDKTTETKIEEENHNTNTNGIEIPVNNKSPSSLSSSSRVQTAQDRKQNSKSYTNQLTEFVSLKSGKTFSSSEKGRKFLFRGKEAPQRCIDTIDNDNRIFATMNNNNKSTTTIMTDNRNFVGSTTTTTTVVGRLATDDTAATTTTTTTSPFGLLEELFSEHPWRLLISTMLLNKTKRNQNIDRILFRLFQRWLTVESVVKDANNDEDTVRDYIFTQVRITGLGRNKSKAFVQLSRDFLLLITTKNQNNIDLFVPYCQYTSTSATNTTTSTAVSPIIRHREVEFNLTRKEVKNISNCGDYAADAFQIFIRKDFDLPIISNDYILVAYVEWKRSLNI